LNKGGISKVKKKITVLMLVSAILCSITVPAVNADEKAAQKQDISVKTETVVKPNSASATATDDKSAAKTDVKTDVKAEVNTDDDTVAPVSTSTPSSELEATPAPSEMPFKKFRSSDVMDKIDASASPMKAGTPSNKAVANTEASAKPENSVKPESSVKPNSSAKPSTSPIASSTPSTSGSPSPSTTPTPSVSPAPSASPKATSEQTETQTKSVTGTIKSIADKKISINVSGDVVEEYLYGSQIKNVKVGDSVMVTYDPKVDYMERIYKASDDFVNEVKFVDFTVSKLNSQDLSDAITNGDLCGLIYNMLVYNEKIIDMVKIEPQSDQESSSISLVEAVDRYTAAHPEAKDQIKVIATGAPSTKNNNSSDKNSLNKLKAQALYRMGYVSSDIAGSTDEKITREDAAVILAAVYSKEVTSSNASSAKTESYSDENSISSEAKSSVLSLQQAGIMTTDSKKFSPKDEYTEGDAIIDILKIEELF
jgi:hypothetical protein